jgi:hypothetical protein
MFSGSHMKPLYNKAGGVEGFQVPTLDAYAIEHAELTPPRDIDSGFSQLSDGEDFWILNDTANLHHPLSSPFLNFEGVLERTRLVIHYHGVRDFSLLFPQIEDSALQTRLGEFYAEAETAFENSAWLSFSLMAGAIYEGLHSWHLRQSNETFAKLIRLALKKGSLEAEDAEILEEARDARNLVHAGRAKDPMIARQDAMDMRRLVDRLVRQFAQNSMSSLP